METTDNLILLTAQRGRPKRFSEMFLDEDEVSAGDTPSKPSKNTNPCSATAADWRVRSERGSPVTKNANRDARACQTATALQELECVSTTEEEDHGLTCSVANTSHVVDAPDEPVPHLTSASAPKKHKRVSGTTSAPDSKVKPIAATSETKGKSSSKRKSNHSATKHSARSRTSHDSATQEREDGSTQRRSKAHSSRKREDTVEEFHLCDANEAKMPPTGDADEEYHRTELLDEEDICCICLETYEVDNPKFTAPCTHHFHLACLLDWKQRNNTCPMCCSETLRGVGGDDVPAPPPINPPNCAMDELMAHRLQVRYLTNTLGQQGRQPQRGGYSQRDGPRPPRANNNGRPQAGSPPGFQSASNSERPRAGVAPGAQGANNNGRPRAGAAPRQAGGGSHSSRTKCGHGGSSSDKKSCVVM